MLLGIETGANDLHVQVIFHVTLAAAITYSILMVERRAVSCIVRAAALRRHRRKLLRILVADAATTRRTLKPMLTQVI